MQAGAAAGSVWGGRCGLQRLIVVCCQLVVLDVGAATGLPLGGLGAPWCSRLGALLSASVTRQAEQQQLELATRVQARGVEQAPPEVSTHRDLDRPAQSVADDLAA